MMLSLKSITRTKVLIIEFHDNHISRIFFSSYFALYSQLNVHISLYLRVYLLSGQLVFFLLLFSFNFIYTSIGLECLGRIIPKFHQCGSHIRNKEKVDLKNKTLFFFSLFFFRNYFLFGINLFMLLILVRLFLSCFDVLF